MPRSFSLHQDINYTSNWQKKACIFGWIWFVNNLPDCFHYIIVLIATNKQESKIKIAFDHNKIIELNFRLICELQYENSTILQGILQSLRCYYCFPFLFIFFRKFLCFLLCGFDWLVSNAASDSFVLGLWHLCEFVCDCWCFDYQNV